MPALNISRKITLIVSTVLVTLLMGTALMLNYRERAEFGEAVREQAENILSVWPEKS